MILSTNRIRYGTSGRRAPLVCSRVSIIDQSLSIASFMDLKSMSEHTILIKVTKYPVKSPEILPPHWVGYFSPEKGGIVDNTEIRL